MTTKTKSSLCTSGTNETTRKMTTSFLSSLMGQAQAHPQAQAQAQSKHGVGPRGLPRMKAMHLHDDVRNYFNHAVSEQSGGGTGGRRRLATERCRIAGLVANRAAFADSLQTLLCSQQLFASTTPARSVIWLGRPSSTHLGLRLGTGGEFWSA